MNAPVRVGLFGGPPDTGNLGVTALGYSTIASLHDAAPAMRFTVFDYGRGVREEQWHIGPRSVPVHRVGLYSTRRWHRPESLDAARAAARCGLASLHPGARAIRALDAVLDISGGDSFSDIYGPKRFAQVCLSKRTALALGRPLILLPQTYGPYASPAARAAASEIMRRAAQVWARDAHSLSIARELLGERFDPERHRAGVDVAFGLPAIEPEAGPWLERLLEARQRGLRVLGLNVSGLLHNVPGVDRQRYGFRAVYRELISRLVEHLVTLDDAIVALVPHVRPRGGDDDDHRAIEGLVAALPAASASRVVVVPAFDDPMRAKWVIGRCDWFCGTRMHACIGAISQGVPTAAIAYSDKTLGVFETANVARAVIDPRRLDTDAALRQVCVTLDEADGLRASLAKARAELDAALRHQAMEIAAACAGRGALGPLSAGPG